MSRVILAATLSGNYGIYGPVYELGETRATASESTEYFDSEQYEIRLWDWERQTELTDLLSKLNQIRRSNAALQSNNRLHFHKIENEQLIAYSKTTKDLGNRILTVINLTPRSGQSGWLDLGRAARFAVGFALHRMRSVDGGAIWVVWQPELCGTWGVRDSGPHIEAGMKRSTFLCGQTSATAPSSSAVESRLDLDQSVFEFSAPPFAASSS